MKTELSFTAGAKAACGAVALSAAVLALSSLEAASLPAKVTKASGTKIAETAVVKDPESTSSIEQADALQPGCQRPRKRLWVEGEGWIVRRVTVCY